MVARKMRRIDYNDPRGYEYWDVDIDLLVPDPENPRIPPQESSNLEIMLAMFRNNPSGLYRLAEDLAKVGTNPAELLNVTRLGPKLFLVKEGNRRLTVRKLLRNPEQLKDHVSPAELRRWKKLSSRVTSELSTRQLVVVGSDHEPWVFRRHQGYQDGIGVDGWDPEAKSRHAQKKLGRHNRATVLRDALMASFPDRFPKMPDRSFSVFERLMDSTETRAHLGLDVDEDGNPKLLRGEWSLRMIEELIKDLRRPREDRQRLTTRTINTIQGAQEYLQKLESRIGDEAFREAQITLTRPASESGGGVQVSDAKATAARRRREPDILKSFNQPTSDRLRHIVNELTKVRKVGAPNAAMILTRVLLELSVDEYSQRVGIDFEGDDPELQQQIKELREFTGRNSYRIPRKLSSAISRAAKFTPSLTDKLAEVIRHLEKNGQITTREADAKVRELSEQEIVPILNDAVHRLHNFPSAERVSRVLQVIQLVFNEIHK
ncbi:MAG TPA: hypothetical protein VEK57_05310 [Thermoanaerobaculia bacterium]|nr:hypothetical protein [Thermoanaerobaculia bacterium]